MLETIIAVEIALLLFYYIINWWMNIYGDMRTCIKCKMKADVVEKGKDYCAECWFQYLSGETIDQYEKRQNELEERRRIKNEDNSWL